jgi:hypothetical protein
MKVEKGSNLNALTIPPFPGKIQSRLRTTYGDCL